MEYRIESEGLVLVPIAFEKFILEFDPMKSEGVQEAFHQVHDHQDT
jgi:hypothetical protein